MLFFDLLNFMAIDARTVVVLTLLDRVYQVNLNFCDNANLLCGWTLILGRVPEAIIICFLLLNWSMEHRTVHNRWRRGARAGNPDFRRCSTAFCNHFSGEAAFQTLSNFGINESVFINFAEQLVVLNPFPLVLLEGHHLLNFETTDFIISHDAPINIMKFLFDFVKNASIKLEYIPNVVDSLFTNIKVLIWDPIL